jgi:hypothetical protein
VDREGAEAMIQGVAWRRVGKPTKASSVFSSVFEGEAHGARLYVRKFPRGWVYEAHAAHGLFLSNAAELSETEAKEHAVACAAALAGMADTIKAWAKGAT